MKKWIVTDIETSVALEYDNYDKAKFDFDVLTKHNIPANIKEITL